MTAGRRPASVPFGRLDYVPTPALVVDLPTARRNHELAVAMLGPGQVMRPHFKAHKNIALTRLQTDGDPARPVSCQTAWEALTLARAGFTDILVTNQVVNSAALFELAEAARGATVAVLVDDPQHVHQADAAAARAQVRFDIFIEIDIGMGRCGVRPNSALLLDLAASVAQSRHLRLGGLQAYAGQVTVIEDPGRRAAAIRASAKLIAAAKDRLAVAGFSVRTISGGSTAHLPFADDTALWTEVQCGSYLLMDAAYGAFADLPFAQAAFALASVISRSPRHAVLDIGLKQLAVDKGPPLWVGAPDRVLRLSDEHTVIPLEDGDGLSVGERTWLVPRHIDPTVNLVPELWLHEDGQATASAVDGRLGARLGETAPA